MVSSARVLSAESNVPRAPSPAVLGAIAVAGGAAAATSVSLAFASDHVDQPGVQATLMVWMVLGYVFAGLVAWWRRPGRFGPLMVAAGFGIFLSSLSWANGSVLFTIGILFDLLPAVLFLHVFLAFPTGRLESRFERALVDPLVTRSGSPRFTPPSTRVGPRSHCTLRRSPTSRDRWPRRRSSRRRTASRSVAGAS